MTDKPATSSQVVEMQNPGQEEQGKTLRRVVVSSFLGNFIEWFDYASSVSYTHLTLPTNREV